MSEVKIFKRIPIIQNQIELLFARELADFVFGQLAHGLFAVYYHVVNRFEVFDTRQIADKIIILWKIAFSGSLKHRLPENVWREFVLFCFY